MSKIFWDTMLFVYLMEDHPKYAPRVAAVLARMEERHDELYTSALAVGEVLVGPYKRGAMQVAERIRDYFQSSAVRVVPFNHDAGVLYGKIRAIHSVKPADAIHLACAAETKADLFLTNDSALVGRVIPGIQFIAGLDTDVF